MSEGGVPRQFIDGGPDQPQPPLVLRAGPLSLQFDRGGLRYIRLGEHEVVRRIYCAVRDADWGTVPDRIENVQVNDRDDSFRIDFDVENRQREIDFAWHGTILGDAGGRVVFEFDGTARSTFRKNRIGLCILHPMACAGLPVEVRHADGTTEKSHFPRYIASQNPFLDLVALRHPVTPDVAVSLSFDGDEFETEDQRNWIDASFKTFCTPLSRPFPVEVRAGERIRQRVTIELHGGSQTPVVTQVADRAVRLELAAKAVGPLPQIGFAIGVDAEPLSPAEAQGIRSLKPAHLRCELRLAENFVPLLRRATATAAEMDAPLEIALFASPRARGALTTLIEQLEQSKPAISRWTIFPDNAWSTTRELFESVAPFLRRYDPQVPLGGGTPASFRELGRPPTDLLDFITWSLTPQVHAFDNASLVETLAAHAATIESARQFTGDLPLVVGPITLKMRVNPYATGKWPSPSPPGELPPLVDIRQLSLFAAGWTLGSVKYLAEGGVGAATYYELVGWRGLMERAGGSLLPSRFPALAGTVFPMYHLFADMGELSGSDVLPVRSSDPLRVEALALRRGPLTRLIVANLSSTASSVTFPWPSDSARARFLEQYNVLEAMTAPGAYRTSGETLPTKDGRLRLDLSPCAIARLDMT